MNHEQFGRCGGQTLRLEPPALGADGVPVDDEAQRSDTQRHRERFVRSIKEECLNRLVPLGERHFRPAVTEYVAHSHGECSSA